MIEGIIHKGLVFVNRKKGFGLIFLSVGMGVFLFRAGCGFLPPQPAFVLDASSRLVGLNDFHDSLLTRPASSNFAGREIIVLLQERPAIPDPRAAEFNPRDCGAIDIQANLSPTRPVRRTAGREIYSRCFGVYDKNPKRVRGSIGAEQGGGIYAHSLIPNRSREPADCMEAVGEFNHIPATESMAGFFSQTGRPTPPISSFLAGGPFEFNSRCGRAGRGGALYGSAGRVAAGQGAARQGFFWMGMQTKRGLALRGAALRCEALLCPAMRSKARIFFGWGANEAGRGVAWRGPARRCLARQCAPRQGFFLDGDGNESRLCEARRGYALRGLARRSKARFF